MGQAYSEDFLKWDLLTLSEALKRKKLSPVEVVRHLLDRIDAVNGKLNAYITVFREEALRAAAQAETEIAAGDEHRSAALGYPVLKYKVVAIMISSVVASLAGAEYAIFQRFVNTSVLGLDKTVEALLATIIGGAGTLAGPEFGATVLRFVQD